MHRRVKAEAQKRQNPEGSFIRSSLRGCFFILPRKRVSRRGNALCYAALAFLPLSTKCWMIMNAPAIRTISAK